MRPGFVMMAHEGLERAAQVARCLALQGAPVVIHVDRKVRRGALAPVLAIRDLPNVTLARRRRRSEWGTWSLVEATRETTKELLARHPEVTHAILISGSCLPLRPISELTQFLAADPEADYIESVSVADVPWIQGGLGAERFEYSFPFSWKRSRAAFDRWVRVQRRIGRKRRMPSGLQPYIGSQWWCLRRETLQAIFSEPDRRRIDRFFRRVWIPDESYFQTLARRHSHKIVCRSLTHACFDWKGRPHILYDDHLETLRHLDAFFARKAWWGAERLYAAFVQSPPERGATPPMAEPDIWTVARRTRVRGRPGLLNAGRFPWWGYEGALSAAPFVVFSGYDEVFEDFRGWLSRQAPEMVAHGRLFGAEGAAFASGGEIDLGGLSSAPALRDYDPESFLANLIRARGDALQSFHVAPSDKSDLWPLISRDRNATVFAIHGAFFRTLSEERGPDSRRRAARLQAREERAIGLTAIPDCRAQVTSWTLAEFARDPAAPLRAVLDHLGLASSGPIEMPRLKPLGGVEDFLTELANSGVTPRVAGEAASWRHFASAAPDGLEEHG